MVVSKYADQSDKGHRMRNDDCGRNSLPQLCRRPPAAGRRVQAKAEVSEKKKEDLQLVLNQIPCFLASATSADNLRLLAH